MPVLNTETTAGIGPFDVIEDVADNPARAAFDAALVRENDAAIVLRNVTVRGAAIDALLAHTLQTDVAIDDPDVCTRPIDVEDIKRQLFLDRGGIKNPRPFSRFNINAHEPLPQ